MIYWFRDWGAVGTAQLLGATLVGAVVLALLGEGSSIFSSD